MVRFGENDKEFFRTRHLITKTFTRDLAVIAVFGFLSFFLHPVGHQNIVAAYSIFVTTGCPWLNIDIEFWRKFSGITTLSLQNSKSKRVDE